MVGGFYLKDGSNLFICITVIYTCHWYLVHNVSINGDSDIVMSRISFSTSFFKGLRPFLYLHYM